MMKRKLGWCILAVALLLSTSYLIHASITTTYIGLTAAQQSDQQWRIHSVDRYGWAIRQNIQAGDILHEINGSSPDLFAPLVKFGMIERAQEITLIRDSHLFTYPIELAFYPNMILFYIVIPTIFMLLMVMICFYIYDRMAGRKTTPLLIGFMVCLGLSYLSSGVSGKGDIPAIAINRVSFLMTPGLFLHFLYAYCLENHIRLFQRYGSHVLYGLAALVISIDLATALGILEIDYQLIRQAELLLFSLGLLAGVLLIWLRYIQNRRTIHQYALKLLGTGMTVSFLPFILLFAFPVAIAGQAIVPVQLVCLFLLPIPLWFFYLATSRKILDIDFVLTRFKYLSLLSFVPSVVTSAVLLSVLEIQRNVYRAIDVVLLVWGAFVFLLFLKEWIEIKVPGRLHGRIDYRDRLYRFGSRLEKVNRVADLEETLIEEIHSIFPYTKAAVVEWSIPPVKITWRRGDAFAPENRHPDLPFPLASEQLVDTDVGSFVELFTTDDRQIVLWVGEKMGRIAFNREEKKHIVALSRSIGIVYEKLIMLEGLTEELAHVIRNKRSASPETSRLLFHIAEQERRRLALDLHDSALQNLLVWHRGLEVVIHDDQILQAPQVIRAKLNEVQEGLKDVIYEIREICNELRPPFIRELGIVPALKQLFQATQLRTDFHVHFTYANMDIHLGDEEVLAIFRIVQELLHNAAKHSQATEVQVHLEWREDQIRLNFSDNGRGTELDQLHSHPEHIGLSGMKERVASLNGTVSIRTEPGQGFAVSLSLRPNDRGVKQIDTYSVG